MRKFIPLALFIGLVWFLYEGLGKDTQKLPSPLIGKPFPAMQVEDFKTGEHYFIQDKLKGKITLFNVWASWCVTCHVEHQMLGNIAKTNLVQMIGINYKDDKKYKNCAINQRDDTLFGDCFLKKHGNPFDWVIFDKLGKLGLELGVYRVPETFLVDSAGIIKFKHLGEITPAIWQNKILPLIQERPLHKYE